MLASAIDVPMLLEKRMAPVESARRSSGSMPASWIVTTALFSLPHKVSSLSMQVTWKPRSARHDPVMSPT